MGQGGRLQGGTLCRGAGWCCAVGWDNILWVLGGVARWHPVGCCER